MVSPVTAKAPAKLDGGEQTANKSFSRPQDLIFREGKTWVPFEVTVREDGFLRA